jgi:hypothetical protein
MDSIPDDAADVERSLLRALTWWAAGSVATGAVLWAGGARTGRAAVSAFGRQNLGWGAIDGAIAVVGWGRRRAGAPPSSASQLRRFLILNAILDVGYIAGGVGLILARERLDQRSNYSASQAVGDGAAVILQGGFLLASDVVHSRRLAALD